MAMTLSLRRIVGIGLAGVLAGTSVGAFASGFQTYDYEGTGDAHGGTAAKGLDASAAWMNPASMTRIKNTSFKAGVTWVHGDFDFDFVSGTGPLGVPFNPADSATAGSLNDDPAKNALIPALFFVRPMDEISDRLFFGLSVYTPFGLATDYDTDSVQRYLATESEVLSFDINPSLAFEVTDFLSIGAGVSVQWLRARLEKAVNAAAVCVAALGNGPCSGAGLGVANSNDIANDFQTRLRADDWSFGWNVGAMLSFFEEKTRIGVHYRSSITHNLDGKAEFEGDGLDALDAFAPGLSVAAGFVDQGIEGNLDLPEITTISLFQQVTSWLDILMDVSYTRWSNFDKLRIDFDNDSRDPSLTNEEWRDTWRFSAGALIHICDNLTIKGGYMYDESPIRTEFRTFRLPGSARQWATAGLRLQTDDERMFLDMGYAHVFFEEGVSHSEEDAINTSTGDPATFATLDGYWRGGADLVSIFFGIQLD